MGCIWFRERNLELQQDSFGRPGGIGDVLGAYGRTPPDVYRADAMKLDGSRINPAHAGVGKRLRGESLRGR